jgi:hypothetical protein
MYLLLKRVLKNNKTVKYVVKDDNGSIQEHTPDTFRLLVKSKKVLGVVYNDLARKSPI